MNPPNKPQNEVLRERSSGTSRRRRGADDTRQQQPPQHENRNVLCLVEEALRVTRRRNLGRRPQEAASQISSGSGNVSAMGCDAGVPIVMTEQTTTSQEIDCIHPVNLAEIKSATVVSVISFWNNTVKALTNWKVLIGEATMHEIQAMDVQIVAAFGWTAAESIDNNDHGARTTIDNNDHGARTTSTIQSTTTTTTAADSDYHSQSLQLAGVQLMGIVDQAISMLQPDLQTQLERRLFDLGASLHESNSRPYHWPVVGKALLQVLEREAGTDEFNHELREQWIQIYNFIGYHMVKGLLWRQLGT